MGHERSYNVTDHCAKIEKEMETFLKVNEEQVEYFAKKAKGKVKRLSKEGGGGREESVGLNLLNQEKNKFKMMKIQRKRLEMSLFLSPEVFPEFQRNLEQNFQCKF